MSRASLHPLALGLALAGSVPTYGPVDTAWTSSRIKIGRPRTATKARNRVRNKIARKSRKANRQ